jgi:hypothetical protein
MRCRGTKWMVVVESADTFLEDLLHSASAAEVRFAKTVLAARTVGVERPSWTIGQ